MVYEGAFFPAGMGWDTYDGIGIGRYMIGLDGMGWERIYPLLLLLLLLLRAPPPSPPLFSKVIYVLCTMYLSE